MCVYTEACCEVNREADVIDVDEPFEIDDKDIIKHRLHDKSRPYLCTVCDKRFRQRAHLCVHTLTHTREQLYCCSECEQCFTSNYHLRRHLTIHSKQPHKCLECGKCFKKSFNLKRHVQSHSGERLFKCAVCSKRFMRSDNLAKHMKSHSGDDGTSPGTFGRFRCILSAFLVTRC